MVQLLTSLVGCSGHAQLGRDCPHGFAAPSAAGAVKEMRDENIPCFPSLAVPRAQHSPSTLGQRGWNKVMVTKADQKSLPSGCWTFLLWSAKNISKLGRRFLPVPSTFQHPWDVHPKT